MTGHLSTLLLYNHPEPTQCIAFPSAPCYNEDSIPLYLYIRK